MAKHVTQRAVVKVIQREQAYYTCDLCGAVCGTRQNPKQTVTRSGGGTLHYCKRSPDGPHWRLKSEVEDAGGWEAWKSSRPSGE